MMQSVKRWSDEGPRVTGMLDKRSGPIAATLVGLVTVILVLLALWAIHQLGSLLGVLMAVALSGLLVIVTSTVAGADILLAPALCLSLLFPLNRGLGSTPFVVYTFDVVLGCLYAVWLYRVATGRVSLIRFSSVDGMALLLIGWLFMSALAGTDVPHSLNGVLYFLRLFLVYLYVANNVRTVTAVKYVMASLLLLVAIQSSLGLAQYLTRSNLGSISDLVGETTAAIREVEVVSGYLFRVRGTLTMDTALSHWFDLLLPLVFSLVLARRVDTMARGALLLLLLMGTASLIFTFTRGAWVGSCAGLMAVLSLWLRERSFRLSNLILVASVLVVLSVLLLPLLGVVAERWFRSAEDTLTVRENLNRAALGMIQRYPVFGVGWDNFAANAPDFGVGFSWQEEGAIHKAHNLYLAFAAEGGILGLVIFLGLLLTVFRAGWDNMKHHDRWAGTLTLGILAGFVGALVHGLVAWGLLTYSVFPLFWVLMGLLVALGRVFGEEKRQETRSASV